MLAKQIPYQVLGVKFFDRKEIKDLLAYIKASLNKESLTDIKRIINTPTRGVGKVTLTKLFAGMFTDLPASMQSKINKFYLLLEEIHVYIDSHKPSEVIKFIIEKSGLEDELSHGTNEEMERLENMKELVTLAIKYDKEEDGIEKLLEDGSLSSDQDSLINKAKTGGVRLMTVHASKGLEFKYVFVTGLEQDLFPHARSNDKPASAGSYGEAKEEERRLFYVALTRAEKKLFLTYASLRTIFGMKQVNTPSEFIYDIPAHLTEFTQSNSISGEKIVYL
jgi:DNA helicase-2/ATP-dependent DNA helicase PcrA